MIHDKITLARKSAGMNLQQLTNECGIPYSELYSQIRHQRSIPFDTIDAIAHHLNLPLEYFSSRARPIEASLDVAQQLISAAKNIIDAQDPRVSGPGVADFWRRLQEVDFNVDELGEMRAYVDTYETASATDEIAKPESFGRNGLARKLLGLCTPKDFFDRVPSFDPSIRKRSIESHLAANDDPFRVYQEIISETIDGKVLSGCYLKAIGQGRDHTGKRRNVVLTQFVTQFQT